MTDLKLEKRVTASEAAAILGVPAHQMSRLDPTGEIIKRYRLTRKTHVYEVSSLYLFLAQCEGKPPQKPVVALGRPLAAQAVAALPKRQRQSLFDLARPRNQEQRCNTQSD